MFVISVEKSQRQNVEIADCQKPYCSQCLNSGIVISHKGLSEIVPGITAYGIKAAGYVNMQFLVIFHYIISSGMV